ncbi:MAG: hypothetical protein JXR95_04810 [Deltaproteobacteria bacterium]|nr:hypothetical protein [Deltaproteobacteria bacterium]
MKKVLLFITLSALIFSCSSGVDNVPLNKKHGMILGKGAASSVDVTNERARVIHYSPSGLQQKVESLIITFSNGIKPLDVIDENGFKPVKLIPDAPYVARWIGVDTIEVFFPKGLVGATEYQVVFKPEMLGKPGEKVDGAVSWKFETPRPTVTYCYPERGSESKSGLLLPDGKIQLTFSQDVSDKELNNFISLSSGGKKSSFRLQYQKYMTKNSQGEKLERINKSVVRIIPDKIFNDGALVSIDVSEGISPLEGSLKSQKPHKCSFRVISPVRFRFEHGGTLITDNTKIPSDRMLSSSPVRIVASEYVHLSQISRAVRLNGRKVVFSNVGDNCNTPKDPCSRYFYMKQSFPPDKKFVFLMEGEISDVNGKSWRGRKRVRFSTLRIPKLIHLPYGEEGFIGSDKSYTVGAVNLRKVVVNSLKISESQFVKSLYCMRDKGFTDRKCLTSLLGKSYMPSLNVNWEGQFKWQSRRTLKYPGGINTLKKRNIKFAPGSHLVVFSSPEFSRMEFSNNEYIRLINVTPWVIKARISKDNAFILVYGIKNAMSPGKVTIRFYDKNGELIQSGITSQDGHLLLQRKVSGAVWGKIYTVTASKGDIWTYHTPFDSNETYFSDHSCRRHDDKWYESNEGDTETADRDWSYGIASTAFVSTERDLYKPSEQIYFHGVARAFRDRIIQKHPSEVKIEIRGRSGDVWFTTRLKTDEFGVFLGKTLIPGNISLGRQTIIARVKNVIVGRFSFNVKNYRPPEIEAFSIGGKYHTVYDELPAPGVFVRYFSGGQLPDARVNYTWTSRCSPVDYFGKNAGYHAGYVWDGIENGCYVKQHGESQTDSGGRFILKTMDKKRLRSLFPLAVNTVFEVFSPSFSTAVTSSWNYLMPGEYIPAFKKEKTNSRIITRKIRLLNYSGKRGSGIVNVELHHTRKIKDRALGTYKMVVRPVFTSSLDVSLSKDSRVVIPLKNAKFGDRYVITYDFVDSKNRKSRTWELVTIVKDPLEDASGSSSRVNKKEEIKPLSIGFDKEEYATGEKIKTEVKKGIPLRNVWLFIEHEKIFKAVPLKFRGNKSVVTLDALKDYEGDITVSLFGITKEKKNPYYLSSEAVSEKLLVYDPGKKISLSMRTDKSGYAPGAYVRLRIKVTDVHGKGVKSEAVVMAVDESVLKLTGYYQKDIISYITWNTSRNMQISSNANRFNKLDMPKLFLSPFTLMGCGYGMGGGGSMGYGSFGRSRVMRRSMGFVRQGNKKNVPPRNIPRKDFRTAAWHGKIATDSEGNGEVKFKLPDNLTAFRIMGFVVDKGIRTVSGSGRITVSAPVMAYPLLPRFVRKGDSFRGGVSIYNNTSEKRSFDVSVKTTSDHLGTVNVRPRSITIKPGSQESVLYDFKGNNVGTTDILFSVRGKEFSDELQRTLSVEETLISETVSGAGMTGKTSTIGIGALKKARFDKGDLEITVTSTITGGARHGMEQLIKYPYGCLEQTSSRLLPLTSVIRMKNNMGLKLKKDPVKFAESGVKRIFSMQNVDGGFGYWPGTGSRFWTTSYALIVLGYVKKANIKVPKKGLNDALSFLESGVLDAMDSASNYSYTDRAFAAHALAMHGRKLKNLAENLFQKRKYAPIFARALAIKYLVKSNFDKKKTALMVKELMNSLKVESEYAYVNTTYGNLWNYYMTSPVRTTAMVLSAVLDAQPQNPMALKMVKYLVQGRQRTDFRNTQEAAWSLMAILDYSDKFEKVTPSYKATVKLGKEIVFSENISRRTFTPLSRRIKLKSIASSLRKSGTSLSFTKNGTGWLYYTARLNYFRKKELSTALSQGMDIKREIIYLSNAGKVLSKGSRVRRGTVAVVVLTVSTDKNRYYTVIDDPVASGFEAIDTTLANSSPALRSLNISHADSYDHRELRDSKTLFFIDKMPSGKHKYFYLVRAVTPGSFKIPGAKISEMYTPEVFGISSPDRAVISE